MRFKHAHLEDEFNQVPIFLREIVRDADALADYFGKEMIVTRVYEPVAGESGVHTDLRAVDTRDEHLGEHTFTPEESAAIVAMINAIYERNDGYKTCIHHGFGGGPEHFHFQVSHSMSAYKNAPN